MDVLVGTRGSSGKLGRWGSGNWEEMIIRLGGIISEDDKDDEGRIISMCCVKCRPETRVANGGMKLWSDSVRLSFMNRIRLRKGAFDEFHYVGRHQSE